MKARILHRGFAPIDAVKATMTVFAVLGLGMLIGGGVFLKSTSDFMATAQRAEGRVIDLEYRRSGEGGAYYPVVRFRGASGEEVTFRSRVGKRPPGYSQGDPVVVLYDPLDPSEAKVESFFELWFGALILGILGSLFGGIGGGYWGWKLLLRRRDAWLDRHGEWITARIVDIYLDDFASVNSQKPWRIRAQWQDPLGTAVCVFTSRILWFDPGPFLKDQEIGVLIDRRDPQRYKFDLSSLPQQEG